MGQTTAVRGRLKVGAATLGKPGYGRGNARAGLLMAAPAFLVVALFTLYPFGMAIYESTRLSSPFFPPEYVGLDNYRNVLDSASFRDALRWTFVFAALVVPIMVGLGVLVAVLLNERFVGNTALRAGMLLPWAIPASVAGLIWRWVFQDSYGALNAGLYSLGIIDEYVEWLSTPGLARLGVIVVFVWTQLPLASVLLLAAIQAVPDDLYEAAALDGAGAFGRFWTITLPGIRPMMVIVGLFELLMAITAFDITYSLTHGGPGTATTMVTYFTWSISYKEIDFGRGSALAIIIALGSLVAIFALLRAMPKDALLDEAR
jgi:ABC-type sugar transport system permease subunit